MVLSKLLNSGDSSRMNILISAVYNETLESFDTLSLMTGLKKEVLEIEAFSAMRGAGFIQSPVYMVCDIGASLTKVSVVAGQFIWLAHTINKGSQEITLNLSKNLGVTVEEAEILKREEGLLTKNEDVKSIINLVFSNVFLEIKRVSSLFEERYKQKPEALILAGGGSLMKGLAEIMKNELSIEVLHADPFSRMAILDVLKPVLKEVGPEFTVASGVALRALEN